LKDVGLPASISERICLWLNKRFKPPKGLEILIDNPTPEGRAEYSYQSAVGKFMKTLELIPEDEQNQRCILDLGCGYGGFVGLLCEKGGGRITGLDIDFEILVSAKKFLFEKKVTRCRVDFVQADSQELPLASNKVDLVYSIATMEHFQNPTKALAECYRVLRKNGLLYVQFSPYYAHNGAHLFDFIHIPWCHLFFSQKTLVRVWKRLAVRNPQLAKLNTSVDLVRSRLAGLNKISVRKFKRLLRESSFHLLSYQENTFDRWHLKIFQKIPWLKELLTVEVIAFLCK